MSRLHVTSVACLLGGLCIFPAVGQDHLQRRALTGADATRAADLQKRITDSEQSDQYQNAVAAAEELLALRERLQGKQHWEAVSARWQRDTLRKIAALPAAQRTDWRIADKGEREAQDLAQKGKYADAIPLHQKMLDLRRKVLGDEHPDVAASHNNLAYSLDAQGQFAAAEKLHDKALAINRKTLGDDHPDTALAYTNRGMSLTNLGRYADAEPLLQRSLTLYLRLRGEEHTNTALGYNNLAFNYASQGRLAEAEPLFERALTIYRRLLGDKHASVALGLNNLAMTYDVQGKTADAEPLLQKALETYKATLGEEHPETALAYSNVAMNLNSQRKFADATPLLRKVLAIRQRVSGEDHPDTFLAINNVAFNLSSQENFAEADPFYQKAFHGYRRVLGPDHPATMLVANNLAMNLNAQGRFTDAEEILRRNLTQRQRLLGAEHPDTALSMGNLSLNLQAQGKHAEALITAAAAAKSYDAVRLRFGSTGFERGAYADTRMPHHFLTAWLARAGRDREAWELLEQHLARGLLDELSARATPTRAAKEVERAHLLRSELARLDHELAANAIPMDDAAKRNHDNAIQKRRETFAEMAQLDAAWAREEVLPLERIQAALPADAALLAWVDVRADVHAVDPGGEHWACVVKRTGPPQWVKLPGTGQQGLWTKDDALAPEHAIQVLARPPKDNSTPLPALRRLHQQRLAPLEKQLVGVKRLLVCSAGWMAGIPIEALTDQYVVSYVPSGSVFARQHDARPRKDVSTASLLAVGDPVYQPSQQSPSALAKRGSAYAPLPGTRREVEALTAIFNGQATVLVGGDASEQRLRELAAKDELRRFRYVHLATHGVVDHRRLLQTALILSQDRLPDPAQEVLGGRRPIDGRLTAQEILNGWSLDADLVTLSACQTGLGRTAGGDGYVGFPQVLLLAGARSVVLSLWQVNDTATSLLMVRFYQNLLGKRQGLDKPLPKAEALHEAKQWLRSLTRDDIENRIADLPEAVRGLKLEGPVAAAAKSDRPFAHPYYWAAFVLTGDPN